MKTADQRKTIVDQSFAIESSNVGPLVPLDDVLHVERSVEQHSLALASNSNPLLVMSVDKRGIVVKLSNGSIFADVAVECHMYLFKWDEVPGTKETAYEQEEIENFTEQCKDHEQRMIKLLDMLKLPI